MNNNRRIKGNGSQRVNRSRKRRGKQNLVLARNPIPRLRRYRVKFLIIGALQDATAGYALLQIRVNDLNNPTPTVTGTSSVTIQVLASIAGFDEYALAHLISCAARLGLVNNATGTGAYVSMGLSDTQPSSVVTTFATANQLSVSQNQTPTKSLGETNANSAGAIVMPPIQISDVVGRRGVYNNSLQFDGSDTTAPNQAIWLNVLVRALASGTNCSVLINLELDLWFEFYSPKIII